MTSDEKPGDRQLLQQVVDGSEEALEILYQRHHLPLYNFVLRLVREPAIAEELLQEVFVAIWRGAGDFQGRAKVQTWMFRIAHNHAVSWLRNNKNTPLLDDLGDHTDPSPASSPEAQFMRGWREDQLLQALSRLSPNHRAVVMLFFVHDLSYSEIAEAIGCPVGTVKSRLSHALRQLNGALRRRGLDELL